MIVNLFNYLYKFDWLILFQYISDKNITKYFILKKTIKIYKNNKLDIKYILNNGKRTYIMFINLVENKIINAIIPG